MFQSSSISTESKTRLWKWAEKYISFYGVNAIISTQDKLKMAVNTSKMVEKQIFYFGEWEPFFTRHLRDAKKQSGVFLDIGANIGYFSLLAAKNFDQVIAIEASPSVAAWLTENVRRNELSNVDVRNIAVGEQLGEAEFFFDEGQSGGSSLLPGKGRVLEAKVPTGPLGEILSDDEIQKVSFIKIDIEGFEHIALRQILDRIGDFQAKLEIVLEYGPERNQDLWEVIMKFIPHGFEICLMQGEYDISEYVDLSKRSELARCHDAPKVFSDILLRRS
ncbi:MAG: FkbM family methyltransferase [Paracoccaceae bacterium]